MSTATAGFMRAPMLGRHVGNAVVAEGLVKRYGALEAVKGIDFNVPERTVFGFLGPNGAGKSSTMRMIHGLSPRSAGRLDVLGLDIATHGRTIKRRLGVVPQEGNLDTEMTARENLIVFGRFYDLTGARLKDRVDELLAYLQLSEKADQRTWELSGGMKRRLLIARALLNDPELLVLDEPTTGLDPQSRSLLWERIRALRRGGKTVLLTTHYLDEAEKLSDDLVIMDGGRIIERGRPRELVDKHVGKEVLELTIDTTHDARIMALAGDTAHVERAGDDIRIFTSRADSVLEDVLRANIHPEAHLVRRASLEDVFLKLTGRRLHD